MRFAVLGLGSIGGRHAANLLSLGHEVMAFDPDPDRRLPDGAVRAVSLQDALAGAEAAIVASPTAAHAEHALTALEAGVAVLVEKPLAQTSAEAQAICETARARGLICGVAMNLRFHPAILELRRLLAEGALGRVLYCRVSSGSDLRKWRPGSDYRVAYSAHSEMGGGVMMDSIHELDYLTWLLGPPVHVSAELEQISDLELDVEDVALAIVSLSSGALAQVDLNYFEPSYRRGCLLVGAGASADWDWSRGTIEIRERAGGETQTISVACDVADTYTREVEQFAEAVRGRGAPRTTAEEGATVVRLAAAMRASALTGTRVAV